MDDSPSSAVVTLRFRPRVPIRRIVLRRAPYVGESADDARRTFWTQATESVRARLDKQPVPGGVDGRIDRLADVALVRDLSLSMVDPNDTSAAREAIAEFEDLIVTKFGRALLLRLEERVGSGRLRAVAIRVERERLSYASFSVGLRIEGADQLAEAFGFYFAALAPILEQFAPLAFQDALSPEVDEPKCDVVDIGTLQQAFRRTTPASRTTQQVRQLWNAANTSLIPAVGIVLFFLYLMHGSLERERDRVADQETELHKARADAFKAQQEFAVEFLKGSMALAASAATRSDGAILAQPVSVAASASARRASHGASAPSP